MRRIVMRTLVCASFVGGVLASGGAMAQAPVGGSSAVGSPITNPYLSPYGNPYLNPALTTNATSRNDALLYLWAAQQQPGGLLGPRPAPPQRPARFAGSSMQPGGNAASYFGRGPTVPENGLNNRYNRINRYFPNNGR